jgi:hypothetical protein
MPHGPTMVKDGEEQIKVVISYFWSTRRSVKFPNPTLEAMNLHNLGCDIYLLNTWGAKSH